MPDRISTKTLHDSIAASIGLRSQKLLKLQMSLSDGRSVRTPSDDPVGAHLSMWFREQTRANDQFERNIQSAITHLNNSEGLLSNLADLIHETRELQTTAASDATGADGRHAIATQVNQLIELYVSLGNDRFAGTYSFGGTNTLEAPLTVERDAEGRITQVAYRRSGASGDRVRQLGADVLLTINVDRADLFGEDASAFRTLIGLRDALEANDGDAIRAMSDPLDGFLDTVLRATASVGALMGRADALLERVQLDRVQYEAGRARAEDVDMARALVEFQQEQTALQAALNAGSRILNQGLLDYLS